MAATYNAQPRGKRRRTPLQWSDFYKPMRRGKAMISDSRFEDPESLIKKLDAVSEFVNKQDG